MDSVDLGVDFFGSPQQQLLETYIAALQEDTLEKDSVAETGNSLESLWALTLSLPSISNIIVGVLVETKVAP